MLTKNIFGDNFVIPKNRVKVKIWVFGQARWSLKSAENTIFSPLRFYWRDWSLFSFVFLCVAWDKPLEQYSNKNYFRGRFCHTPNWVKVKIWALRTSLMELEFCKIFTNFEICDFFKFLWTVISPDKMHHTNALFCVVWTV